MITRLSRLTITFAIALSVLMLSISPHPACAQNVTLAGNHPGAAASLTGRVAADQPLTIHVSFALRDRAKLQALLAAQQNPASPKFHKWLETGEFDSRFGRTKAEVNAVSNWLGDQGFLVTAVNPLGITMTGNAAIAEAAFHTTIAASPDGTVFANVSDPEIPAQFDGIIGAIDGLDNTLRAVPLLHRIPGGAGSLGNPSPALAADLALAGLTGGDTSPEYSGGSGTAFGPADFYTFYDETSLLNGGTNGSGSDCIGLIEDSNYLPSAVTLFDTTFGLPTANITNVFPDTANPGITGDEIEVLLDIEWGHAVAPDAPLRAYMGEGGNALPDAITRAVSDNACSSISISYAFCATSASFFTGTLDPQFSKAASQGQSVFVSAGDQGSAGLNSSCAVATTQNVSEMSADPNVTAVGGTQFVPSFNGSGNDTGSVAESVWNDPAGATGGGKSTVFSKPSFQTANTPADGKRDVPDIAYGSSPYYPGYYMVVDDAGTADLTCCIGGTSIAAPMWAGLVRLIDQRSGRPGNIDTRLYQLGPSGSSAGLRDVTTANDSANHSVGSNTYNSVAGFTTVTGYDQSTGWGSADATNFVNAFPVASGSPTPTPTATPTPSSTPTPSPTPTRTPAPSSTPTPTATPTPTSKPLAPTLSPTAVNFGAETENTTSQSHNLTVTNPKTSPANLVISGSTISSHFSIYSPSTTCTNGKSLAAGSSCIFALRFSPTTTGKISGTLLITDNASNSPQTVLLSGVGNR